MEHDRLAHALELTEELLADIELSRIPVGAIALKASRLARIVEDTEAQEWVALEIGGYNNTSTAAFDRSMEASGRWSRTDPKGLTQPVAELDANIAAAEAQLQASTLPSLSGDGMYVTARDTRDAQSGLRQLVGTLAGVRARVLARLYELAARHNYELRFSAHQAALFDDARLRVDRLLAPITSGALEKVDSIYRRLGEGDAEAISQALTTCRRLIDSVADAVHPPSDETRDLGGGNKLKLTKSHVQNRINVVVHDRTSSMSRRKKLRRTLSDLYDRVSTGVHDDVTPDEARYLFLNTYLFLGEVLSLSEDAP